MGEVAILKTTELLSSNDIDVLRNSKFKGFTDQEIGYCRQVCTHLTLNPLLNQIHFVKRTVGGTPTITVQVGIDGFRLTAQRTGAYAGSDEPVFEMKGTKPEKATVTVYKIVDGQRCAFTAAAWWDEYYPGEGANGTMWRKMPRGQLAKCAEALALRKAFPAELSAFRTDEEMVQADGATVVSKAKSLNDRKPAKPAEAPVQDAEIVEPQAEQPPAPAEQKSEEAHVGFPAAQTCCGKKTMVSKYPIKEGPRQGKFDWYCTKCKTSYPREPQ